MEKLYGWTGKILRIDLTTGEKGFLSTREIAETSGIAKNRIYAEAIRISKELESG